MSTGVDASGVALERDMRALEQELQVMQNEWAAAEADLVRATARVERLAASHRLRLRNAPAVFSTPKPTKDDLDAMVLQLLWSTEEADMVAQLDAEARCAAFRTTYKVAASVLSAKQTRLNAEIRLHGSR